MPICATLIEVNRMDLLPKDTECRLLEEVLKVLKPFKDVSVQVSAKTYVTTCAIRPLIHHFTQKALRAEDADSLAIKSMKQEMANLQSRYQEPVVKELLEFSCFVDPRFKSMPFLDANKQEELHEDFLAEVMMKLTPDAKQDEELDSGKEQENLELPSKKTKSGLGMFTMPAANKRMSIREKAEQEIHRYIHDEPSPSVDDDILQWWRQNCNRFPAIAEIARKRLCVPATSTFRKAILKGLVYHQLKVCCIRARKCFLTENLS